MAQLPAGTTIERLLCHPRLPWIAGRSWRAGDLETVTDVSDGDPSWLRIQAAVNGRR
ncbi:hypothetical protein [Actinoplanes sp. RD1]|uniref:hypothetical protein n=1 Tax=Actinoplanes sp. RD1 TaxID=3064538 RepID=UPI00274111A2|nr:hypothetical protein [Actinoplanes sp. RD1]